MPKPIINSDKCTGCKTCVEICPVEVFAIKDGKATVKNADACIGCRACEAQCEAEAIKIED